MILPRITHGSSIETVPTEPRLQIAACNTGDYTLAQLDNYTRLSRLNFPSHSPAG